MNLSDLKFAQLNDMQLAKLKQLEKDLGTVVIAVEPKVEMATLSHEQLNQLQAAEQELGKILLAVQSD